MSNTTPPPSQQTQSRSSWRPSWRFTWQIFLGYFVIVGVAAFIILQSFMEELRPGVRQSQEDSLVNTANLLAELVVTSMLSADTPHTLLSTPNLQTQLPSSEFATAFQRFSARILNAQIWFLQKSAPDLHIYVTDKYGTVVYDSKQQSLGQDYSRWNDVYLTLKGEYGARSTPTDPHDPNSSEMYIAAPIVFQDELIGVLTVVKPTFTVMPFVQRAEEQLRWKSLVLLSASLILGLALAYGLTHSIRKLEHFVHRIRQGYNDPVPNIRKGEFSRLATAIGDMRDELEGKAYVERYVQTLTHELKSPITSIQGAAEIIQELTHHTVQQTTTHTTATNTTTTNTTPALTLEDYQAIQRFSDNIRQDTLRLEHLVNQLLQLSALEKQRQLEHAITLNISALIHEQQQHYQAQLDKKQNHFQVKIASPYSVIGDKTLLALAISNLLSNAVRFSEPQSAIIIAVQHYDDSLAISIENQGPQIPDFAQDKLFERFYSLSPTDHSLRSSGLGLSIVKEIADLHHGTIRLTNVQQGVRATLCLPFNE